MKTYLLYKHTRSVLRDNNFNSSIKKWFVNPRFEGSLSGNWGAIISVDNYNDVKNSLPKSIRPIEASSNIKDLY